MKTKVKPASFQNFAKEAKLSESDLRSLAGLSTRQRKPRQIVSVLENVRKPRKEVVSVANESVSEHTEKHSQQRKESSGEVKPPIVWRDDFLAAMGNHPKFDVIEGSIDYLEELHKAIKDKDGFLEATSNGCWKNILARMQEGHCSPPSTIEESEGLFYLARELLFPYYFLKMTGIEKWQIPYMPTLFIEADNLLEGIKDLKHGLEFYNRDILVFRNGQEALGLDTEKLNLDRVAQEFGEYEIDVRRQNPLDLGFIKEKLLNLPFKMKLKYFREYQKIYKSKDKMSHFRYAKELKGEEIFFGVNFDPENSQFVADALDNVLENSFLSHAQQFDLLSYLEFDIPGCSFPQLYFKVKGCWTGGHQENINMSAVNINHGPGYSEWYSLDNQYVEDFRSYLKQYTAKQSKKGEGVDIITSEGLWYQNLQWFIEHGFPVRRLLQKEGDIVISGPGTLHWVRSYGVSLQSAWNVMVKTPHQIRCALHRHRENRKVNFVRQNVIPLKTVFLQYLNHQHKTMVEQSLALICEALHEWLKEEKDARALILQKNQTIAEDKMPIYDFQGFCNRCLNQVMVFYVYDSPNRRTPQIPHPISCLQCLLKDQEFLLSSKKIKYRYDSHNVEKLLQFSTDPIRNLTFGEITELCNGNFIGDIDCQVKRTKDQQKETMQNEDQKYEVSGQKLQYKEQPESPTNNNPLAKLLCSKDKLAKHWININRNEHDIIERLVKATEEGEIYEQPKTKKKLDKQLGKRSRENSRVEGCSDHSSSSRHNSQDRFKNDGTRSRDKKHRRSSSPANQRHHHHHHRHRDHEQHIPVKPLQKSPEELQKLFAKEDVKIFSEIHMYGRKTTSVINYSDRSVNTFINFKNQDEASIASSDFSENAENCISEYYDYSDSNYNFSKQHLVKKRVYDNRKPMNQGTGERGQGNQGNKSNTRKQPYEGNGERSHRSYGNQFGNYRGRDSQDSGYGGNKRQDSYNSRGNYKQNQRMAPVPAPIEEEDVEY